MTQTWVSSFHRAASRAIAPPTIVTLNPLPQGFTGANYSAPMLGLGRPPFVWSIVGTTGTNVYSVSGQSITGLPTNAETDFLTIGMTDATGLAAPNTTFRLVVNPVLTALWPDPLPAGTVGVPYSYTLTAVNGVPPYTFAITAGTLPTGLSLNPATGAITGTPTVSVSFAGITFSVTDSSP